MDEYQKKEIIIHKKLAKQLEKLKSENPDSHVKVFATIKLLESYRFEENTLVTKTIEKNLYELKIDGYNKFIRVFYSESSKQIQCWELLEKKTNKIPINILKNIRKKIKKLE